MPCGFSKRILPFKFVVIGCDKCDRSSLPSCGRAVAKSQMVVSLRVKPSFGAGFWPQIFPNFDLQILTRHMDTSGFEG